MQTVDEWSLYTAPEEDIDADLLRSFIDEQRESRLLTESMTLELKRRRQGDNVVRAIAGLANTDGGIVLVGVDEDNPTFDNSPGVPATEVVAIADSCRNVLSPLVQPSIVPVRLADRELVVVVVRVDADPTIAPVCKSGTVFVRAPGQTVPATREQILALATRPSNVGLPQQSVPALNTLFYPTHDPAGSGSSRDALIRVAGGVWLRPSVGEFMFGTAHRTSLRNTIDATPFARYPALGNFRWRRANERPHCSEESFTSDSATFVVDYPDGDVLYRVRVRLRRDWHRFAYALDLELCLRLSGPTGGDGSDVEPRLGREELTTALTTGVETAAIMLPSQIATLARSAPQHLDNVCVWVQNPSTSFDSLLDLRQYRRISRDSMGSQWGWERPAPRDVSEATATVRTELERLYLNLGLEDAEAVAGDDIRLALSEREEILALD